MHLQTIGRKETENEKKPRWLGYMGDEILPNSVGINSTPL